MVVVGIMRDDAAPHHVRAVCANTILDRGWGRAPIMVAGDEDRPLRVDVRHMDATQLEALESLLMKAIGQGIRDAITQPNAALDAQYTDDSVQSQRTASPSQEDGSQVAGDKPLLMGGNRFQRAARARREAQSQELEQGAQGESETIEGEAPTG